MSTWTQVKVNNATRVLLERVRDLLAESAKKAGRLRIAPPEYWDGISLSDLIEYMANETIDRELRRRASLDRRSDRRKRRTLDSRWTLADNGRHPDDGPSGGTEPDGGTPPAGPAA